MGNFLWGNGVSKEDLETKHIVIIGGGYGGMELAAELQNLGIPFTLIDPKEFFHHNVGALRATVRQDWMKQTVINFKETFGDKFIQAKVSNVDFETKKVFLEDSDKEIDYTDVVFAVGSDGPFPGRPNSKTIEVKKKITFLLFLYPCLVILKRWLHFFNRTCEKSTKSSVIKVCKALNS